MDPSRNNSFGGSDSDRNNPGVNGVQSNPLAQPNPVQSNPVQSNPVQPNAVQSNLARPASQQFISQQPIPQQPVFTSVGLGNVMLDSKRKKNKIIMIFLVILGILLVVAVVCVIIAGVSNSSQDIANTRDSFNRYANYYLTGEKSVDDIKGLQVDLEDTAFSLELEGAVFEGENNKDYYSTLMDYYEDFYGYFLSSYTEYDSDLLEFIKIYREKLELMAYYYDGHLLSRSDILDVYLSGGEDVARELIAETFEIYKNLSDLHSVNYYNAATTEAEAVLDVIIRYDSLGCVVDNYIDYGCSAIDDVVNKMEVELTDYYFDRQMILDNVANDLYFGIFEIRNGLYVGSENGARGVNDEK